MQPKSNNKNPLPLKERLHEIIFEADTKRGRFFDIALLIFILASVIVVMLESVSEYEANYSKLFFTLEWVFTIFFTIEYGLRIYSVYKPWKYITSFFGIIDLLSILPAYLSLLLPVTHYLIVIRALRLLRIFRVLKLVNFTRQGKIISTALLQSRFKIAVFMTFVLTLTLILGSVMYVIEGSAGNTKFDSIPRSIYWAIVTLTTVGYGDITPQSSIGQFVSALVMILGYAVIAVPTGIVSAELVNSERKRMRQVSKNTQACRYCSKEGHDDNADFCKFCGGELKHPDEV